MDRYRVAPDQSVDLNRWDPDDKSLFPISKKEGKKLLKDLNQELEALQELLYGEGKHKILIVLQAMDAGGKDGTIRHVFEGVNPQGVKVASFKVPSKKEMAHDYLWRVHAQTPGKGEITIFNRSHYEDVLVVRVDELEPESVWSRRYEHIRSFEKILADEGTTILKFYLHINKKEQKERFQDRLDEPDKNWKFSLGDLEKRRQWEQYIQAYQDALGKTSTEYAPWYVIPANRKWYRNLVISTIIINTLKNLKMEFPEPEDDLSEVMID
jgi:PPK2 family polyphosphate:nucleotide phosphotransferase